VRPLLLVLVLAGSGCAATTAGTTSLPKIGARQVRSYACDVDLSSGAAEVAPVLQADEASRANRSLELYGKSRSFKVSVDDNRIGHAWEESWVRVSVHEFGENGIYLRTIPVQVFLGAHDQHAVSGLGLKDGRLRFVVEFWTDD
jgi:hypothetical protein